jgi:hypothetical protein
MGLKKLRLLFGHAQEIFEVLKRDRPFRNGYAVIVDGRARLNNVIHRLYID